MAGITTTDAVYRQLLTQLKTVASVDDAFIYIAPRPIFTQEAQQYVQLVPGVPNSVDPRSGTGLVEEEFDVAVWSRLLSDQVPQSTDRISDATFGILKIVGEVRAALLQYEGSEVTIPVHWLHGSIANESEEHPGWVEMSDTHRVGYEVAA